MTSAVLLRKLTRKSIMNFGKFSELTVQQCIDTKKKSYLRWVYFNSSNITFVDEILDELKISTEYRFDKPNKNVELGKKLNDFLKESWSEWFAEKVEKRAKRLAISREIKNEVRDNINNTPIKLMNKNRCK